MISISELFLLLINCILNGSGENIKDLCISSEMIRIPYVAVTEDEKLPKFDNAYWYAVPYFESYDAKLEVLIKDGKVLQSGVEIVYNKDRLEVANLDFNEINNIALKYYGNSIKNELEGFVSFSFSDKNTVFYILKGETNGYPIIVFRAVNKKYWQ